MALSLYLWLSTYNRLLGDDFCSYYDAERLDVLHYIWYWYITWGGRYSAIATDNLLGFIGPEGVRFTTSAIILIWATVLIITFRKILQKRIPDNITMISSAALTVTLLFTLIMITPLSPQVFYWWNGMRTYIPALVSFTLHMAFLFWGAEKLSTRRTLLLGSLFSLSLAFFSGGFNETFTAIQIPFFAGLIAFTLFFKKMRFPAGLSPLLFAALLGSVLALTIMLVAPGATNRQDYFPTHPDIITMFRITIEGYLAYWNTILQDSGKILALLGMSISSIWIGSQATKKLSNGWTLITATVGGGILLSCASLLTSAYAISEMPGPRTFVIPAYFIVLGFMLGGLILGQMISQTNFMKKSAVYTAFSLLAAISILLSTIMNARAIYAEREQFFAFAELWDQTDALIIQAKLNQDRSVTIPGMDNWAGVERPTPKKDYWPNVCYTLYYDIQVYGPRYSESAQNK